MKTNREKSLRRAQGWVAGAILLVQLLSACGGLPTPKATEVVSPQPVETEEIEVPTEEPTITPTPDHTLPAEDNFLSAQSAFCDPVFTWQSERKITLENVPRNATYLKDLIILTGESSLLYQIDEASNLLDKIDYFTFNYLENDHDYNGFEIALFELPPVPLDDNPDERDILEQLLQVDLDGDGTVYPLEEDNYNAPYIDVVYLQGAPWVGEGSPWVGEGSPWVGEGSSMDGSGAEEVSDGGEPPSPWDANAAFWNQWALADVSADLNLTPNATLQATSNAEENGSIPLRIGVFDTSPFDQEGAWSVTRGPRTFNFCNTRPTFPIDLTLASTETVDHRDHGLFATGLANAIEPAAELYIIRVLNDQGVGDLFTLAKSINHFLETSLDINESLPQQMDLQGTVLNLSLGYEPLSVTHSEMIGAEMSIDFDDDGNPRSTLWESLTNFTINNPLRSFKAISIPADIANEYGAVIVASSGNGSATQKCAKPPQKPADLESVISVGALTRDGYRSCFSNEASFYAPGGDGGPLPTPTPRGSAAQCAPLQTSCDSLDPECNYAVISTIRVSGEGSNGYGLWVGTSFSAPIVSGLSAALLHEGVEPSGLEDALSEIVKITPLEREDSCD